MSRQRLRLVVEVDQQRLPEARFDEAVGVAVISRMQLFVAEVVDDVVCEDLRLEMGDGPGFRGRQVGGITEREDVRLGRRLQRALVGTDEAERVPETR